MPNKKKSIITNIIILINILIFMYEIKKFGNTIIFGAASPKQLMSLGANYGNLSLTKEPQRLLYSMFLHVNLLHIFSNMFTLFLFGPALETRIEPLGYLFLYLLTGIAGNFISSLMNPTIVAVGASGAIFGILGALLFFSFFSPIKTHISFILIFLLIFLNIGIGLKDPSIDINAHLGGLLTGLIVALIIFIIEKIFSFITFIFKKIVKFYSH